MNYVCFAKVCGNMENYISKRMERRWEIGLRINKEEK